MKKLKRNKKAFGAFEYTIIISLVIVVSLIILSLVKGRAGESISTLDKATSAAENALGFGSGGAGGTGGGEVNSISVDFSTSFEYDFEDEIEVAVENYFTNHATVRKDGEVASYNLSGITRAGNYIQVDVGIDGETKREQFAFNNLCLATDSDFEWKTGWPWDGAYHFIGSAKCVEMPHIINGTEITSYSGMFFNTDVKKVISINSNVTNMSSMFLNSQATSLDLSSFDTSSVTNMSNMFSNTQVTSLDLSSLNTSNVTNMNSMFRYSNATSLDLSSFDTSNVIDMGLMFEQSNLTSLDLSSFNTSKVTHMSSMFGSSQATSLDLSSFDTSNVTDMSGMFSDSQATALDLSSFNTLNVTDMRWMFYNSQVISLDLSNFDFIKASVFNIFEDAQTTEVLVKDAASQTKLNASSSKPTHTIISIK